MRRIAVVVALVAVLFGACSKNDNPSLDNAAPAPTDLNVTTKDFAFSDFPATLNVDNLAKLTIHNEGTQQHEAAIISLPQGKTVDDVKAFLAQKTASGPPPFAL